jgi:FMN phosphatase YigB (HAD superfamily)
VRALGLEGKFRQIYVVAVEDPKRLGKQCFFAQIMEDGGYALEEVLVIGDNADSEIGAAQRLGVSAVQTLRPGVRRSSLAQHHIKRLTELSGLLRSLSAGAESFRDGHYCVLTGTDSWENANVFLELVRKARHTS